MTREVLFLILKQFVNKLLNTMSWVPYWSKSTESVSYIVNCQDKNFIVSAALSLLPPWVKFTSLSAKLIYIALTLRNIKCLASCKKCLKYSLKGALLAIDWLNFRDLYLFVFSYIRKIIGGNVYFDIQTSLWQLFWNAFQEVMVLPYFSVLLLDWELLVNND